MAERSQFAARGRIWLAPHAGIKSWHYTVTDWRGNVIAWDDCTDYDEVQRLCRYDVAAATRMSQLGQKFKPYARLIEKARFE